MLICHQLNIAKGLDKVFLNYSSIVTYLLTLLYDNAVAE